MGHRCILSSRLSVRSDWHGKAFQLQPAHPKESYTNIRITEYCSKLETYSAQCAVSSGNKRDCLKHRRV